MPIELTTASNATLSGIRGALQVPSVNQVVISDTTNTPTASAVSNIVMITQDNYDALMTKDPSTLYFIVG
jgi:hypothetical protein